MELNQLDWLYEEMELRRNLDIEYLTEELED